MAFHPLEGASQRVERAGKHLAELDGLIAGFRQIYLHAIGIKFDPKPPYKVSVVTPEGFTHPEHLMGIIIGEICYNLRAALDYLVYELAILDSGSIQDGTQFPIERKPKKFRERAPIFLNGLNPAHIAAIEGYQPYKGCKWTETLMEISNPDKHRRLTITDYGKIVKAYSGTIERVKAAEPAMSYIRRTNRPDGVEVDVELSSAVFITLPVKQNIAWRGHSVEYTLHQLKAEVAEVLETFYPEF